MPFKSRPVRSSALSLSLVGLALALGACGQAPVDPLAPFTTQRLSWQACDPTLIPSEDIRADLGDRAQCADVQVPLDWNEPSRGTVSVALLRVKAAQPAQRQGSIFFNPGGPGGDGLLFGALYGYLWSNANPNTPAGTALETLSERYDLIGFSPRGVGQSTQVTCGTNESFSVEGDLDDRSEANIAAQLRNARLVALACAKNPLTSYITTDATARDLDLARQLMGDEKFNYVGYSYGTWLGAWYAKLFPTRVGRMVLDGNMNFDSTMQKNWEPDNFAFERAFRDVALAYTARNDDVFKLGKTKDAVWTWYKSLPAKVRTALLNFENSLSGSLYSAGGIASIPVSLVAAKGFTAVLDAYDPTEEDADAYEAVSKLLGEYTFSSNATLNALARLSAYALFDTYWAADVPYTNPIRLGDDSATFYSVICNDTPWTRDTTYWANLGTSQANAYPFMGGQVTSQPCAFWRPTTLPKPGVPSELPPILMVQNELDPATPREGALQAFKSLPNARMIFIDDEPQHTAFPYGTRCVDVSVAQYLLDGTLPAKKFNVCAALPLPGERQTYPVGDTYTSSDVTPAASVASSAFRDTAVTREALKTLKDIVQRPSVGRP